MKVPSKAPEPTWMSGVKLGIVRLGRAAGKMKYTLLDENDITLVQEFAFEAQVNIDKDGSGARIYAFAYDMTRGRSHGQYVHDLLWERRYGGIAPGFKVIHRNNITMDNRLANLCLVSRDFFGLIPMETRMRHREQSLYWAAINELPPDQVAQENTAEANKLKRFNVNGELVDEEDTTYYECHYPPCSNIEKEPREFSICGRCQEARYCGAFCQQKNWPIHKTFCQEKPRLVLRERFPER